MRYPLEVFQATRKIWPEHLPLGVRISATDWVDTSSWAIDEAKIFARELEKLGCDFIDVSSGGNSPNQNIEAGPGYQVAFAAEIRNNTNMKIMTVGQISQATQAESILRSGQADMIALGRGMLFNPRWAWHAAESLRSEANFAPQYARSHPSLCGLPIPGNPPVAKK